MKTVYEITKAGFPIRLEQSEAKARGNLFRVTYGQQVRDSLSYREAAQELGGAIMHAAACEGLLDVHQPEDAFSGDGLPNDGAEIERDIPAGNLADDDTARHLGDEDSRNHSEN